MRIKLKRLLWGSAVFLLGVLLIITQTVRDAGWQDLILVAPSAVNPAEIDTGRLDEINGKSLLITYEIESTGLLAALNSNYDVTLKKTNYAYPFVTGFKLIDGSFFTEKDGKEKKRLAVLNRSAAIAIFGSTDVSGSEVEINGKWFTVTGVIEDMDDMAWAGKGDRLEDSRNNVYVPALCFGENPASFLLKLSGMTEKQAKASYKALTVPESGYVSVSFGGMTHFLQDLILAAVKFACAGILLAVLTKAISGLRGELKQVGSLARRLYLRQMIKDHSLPLMKAAGYFALAALASASALYLLFDIIYFFIKWNGQALFQDYVNFSSAERYAESLEQTVALAVCLSVAFAANIIMLLFLNRSKVSK